MSFEATYSDGVFKPLKKVRGARQGKIYRVFSEEELRNLREIQGWLKASEKSFEFWDNEEDAIYDSL